MTLLRSETGGNLSTSGIPNCAVPMLGVFLQQIGEYGFGLGAELIEVISFLFSHPVGPLAPRAQRTVESEMTKQVEGIRFRLVTRLSQRIKVDAALFELGDDLGAECRVRPVLSQVGGGGIERAHLLGCVLGKTHDTQLAAVRIELVHQMRGDLDSATVEKIFTPHALGVVRDRRTSLFFEFRNGSALAPVGETLLLANLSIVPTGGIELRQNVF